MRDKVMMTFYIASSFVVPMGILYWIDIKEYDNKMVPAGYKLRGEVWSV